MTNNSLAEWESRLAIHDLQTAILRPREIKSRGREQLGHLLKRFQNPKVLEVGCGTAFNYGIFKGQGIQFDYQGYDCHEEYLNQARITYGDSIVLKRGYAHDLPHEDHFFEVAIVNGLEYMSPTNAYVAIEEAVRVSSQEAILYFSIKPNNGFEDVPLSLERTCYSWPKLMKFCSRFGRRVSREDVFDFGSDKPDVLIRLVV